MSSSRWWVVLQAVIVTVLWSSSWVFIKIGLQDLPALTFAGLRYSIAFFMLLALTLRKGGFRQLQGLGRLEWARLIALGLLLYTITQGAQFLGLAYLPAVTVSLLLSFTPVVVAWLGIPVLGERLRAHQWLGVFMFLAGAAVYFYPLAVPAFQTVGLIVVVVGVLANAASALLGRGVNRDQNIDPLVLTTVTMGVGALPLLAIGWATQGWPELNAQHWGIVLWLALVNTAFAFTLWNKTLRTLTAIESSIINNTMLIQIALLAWVFLGERLSPIEFFGVLLAGAGALAVQLRPK